MKGYIRFAIFIVLLAQMCDTVFVCSKESTKEIDEVPISSEAKDILLHKMQEVIITITSPAAFGKAIEDEASRQDFIVAFLDAWRGKIVQVGREFDANIKNRQEDWAGIPITLINSHLVGRQKGYDLAQQWQFEVVAEVSCLHSKRSLEERIEMWATPLSRKEILQSHPHVEALIYLSEVLARPTDPPARLPPQTKNESLK